MPKYTDAENMAPLLPDGDYIYCVVGFASRISRGAKTAGSDQYEIELEIEPDGGRVVDFFTDHPSTAWRLDVFLKSAGQKLVKGESYEFREDAAASIGCKWIDPIGLRGWCKVVRETLPKREGYTTERVANKIAIYYTDREKLPRREVEEEQAPF